MNGFNPKIQKAKEYTEKIAQSKIESFFPSIISNKFDLTVEETVYLLESLEKEGILRHSFVLINEERPSERVYFENRESYKELLNHEYEGFDDQNPIYIEEDMIYIIYSGTKEYKKYVEDSRENKKK